MSEVSAHTLEVKGPVMLDIEGLALTQADKELLQNPAVGGLILFSRNYESTAQLSELISSARNLQPSLLVAVDHEGGRVQRFKSEFTRIPPMAALGQLFQNNQSLAREQAWEYGHLLAAELIAVGVDFSFAPVLDLDVDSNSAIGDRAFSDKPEVVTELAGALIDGMHEAGMAVTGKHFPGHGGVVEDSHTIIPIDKRDLEEVRSRDLIPFCQLLPKLDAIMPAHIIFEKIDPWPVGVSPFWLQELLRGELNFDGVIFSDDLSMEGAAFAGGYKERATKALAAGCDMVLVCNNRAGALEVVEAIEHMNNVQMNSIKNSKRLSAMVRRRSWDSTSVGKLRQNIGHL